ncbi:unnamed protein product [Macrosiphum euphorbiae]|uniref:Uncharacterized protein n=1 Tax=Macrosiphum euphorbiae TaxID=13131 RepID=A0AAV0XC95_9HEMI|nr:unnamed protein product [Macrosiphum euphorbiae]
MKRSSLLVCCGITLLYLSDRLDSRTVAPIVYLTTAIPSVADPNGYYDEGDVGGRSGTYYDGAGVGAGGQSGYYGGGAGGKAGYYGGAAAVINPDITAAVAVNKPDITAAVAVNPEVTAASGRPDITAGDRRQRPPPRTEVTGTGPCRSRPSGA